MYHLHPLSVGAKDMAKGCIVVALIAFFYIGQGCRSDLKGPDPSERPFLVIDNGRFEVDAVVVAEDSNSNDLGSGSLSFSFSGDVSGTYSASGRLATNQKDHAGAGAVITLIENVDFNRIEEGFSVVGFHPIGGGRADVLVLGSKHLVSFASLKAGDTYGIGPDFPFNGLYLAGVNIDKFWAGAEDLLETANKAFVIRFGAISITARDSTHIIGTFLGTTDPNRSSLSKNTIPR
jgi:hypothetical protein